jgi:hypothetical protein
MDYQVSDSATLVPRQMARASGMWDARIAWLNWLHDALFMNNYHVTRCQGLVNNPNVSSELRMIAEALLAIGSGIDDADSMAQ